ncbi:hypothetical protein VU06_00785, partial [Desulfobulbus sp. F3]|nr:hypothetical protein [Desulfobulbus sp. F3]
MIEITPVHSLDAVVRVPGSKSLTQRALIASALAEGEPVLLGPLASEDTRYTMEYYAAIKKNKFMSFAGTWMKLETII